MRLHVLYVVTYSLLCSDFGTPPPGYVPGVGRGAKSIEQGLFHATSLYVMLR